MSDNVDYGFMKSGFDNLESKDETLENVGSVVMTFMENAMKSADIYVKHAKRNSITPEDIKRGLMLEVFLMKNRPNMLEQCETMKTRIKEIIRDEEENGEEVIIGEEKEEEDEPFTVSTCRCAICNCFNNIYTRWEGFTPELPMEKILIKSINAIHTET
tara:strand:+ start:94 stop:570 length:477 start_codon:yes stop_codon:yes gene_type:complete